MKASLLSLWIEEELAIHDPATDATLLLNESAGRIAELCDGARSVDEIACQLGTEFGVDLASAVRRVVDELASRGVLERDGL